MERKEKRGREVGACFFCFFFSRPLTTLLGLVGAITAVVVVVAHKVLGDALSILAHELIAAAGVVEH